MAALFGAMAMLAVKLAYAYAADRAGTVLGKSTTGLAMNRAAACVMMAVGFFLIIFGGGRA